MANHRRDGAKERFWRRVLARQAASRLSVRAFCRREKLSEPSFYAWRRTIHARDMDAPSPTGRGKSPTGRGKSPTGRGGPPTGRKGPPQRAAFLPLVIDDDFRRDGAITIELASPRRAGSVRVLRVPESIAAERLAELVHALEATAQQPEASR